MPCFFNMAGYPAFLKLYLVGIVIPDRSPTTISPIFTATSLVVAITPSRNSLRVNACGKTSGWAGTRLGYKKIRFEG